VHRERLSLRPLKVHSQNLERSTPCSVGRHIASSFPATTARSQEAVTTIESSRKHGQFDGRWPVRPKIATRRWVPERDDDASDQLDWSAFLTRFAPDRRRHDRAALAAYEAYKHWLRLQMKGSVG
jgi:hypothetical protein